MTSSEPNQAITAVQKKKASDRLLRFQPLLKGAAKSIVYLTAGVTAYCLLPGTPAGLLIPAALTPLIEAIGPDLLASIVEKVAEGKEKSDNDLFAIFESAAAVLALTERQLANLPTRRDLYRAVSYLAEQEDKNQQQILTNQDEMMAALQQILSGRPSVPLFHGVPDMPTHFLGRDDLVTDLAARLTSGQTMALSAEGLPGVGKTALAVVLAHDRRVLAHFSDGVLWAGLGTEGEALNALSSWADALGGNVSHYPTAPARSQAVKDLIGQRRLLLVIDDAWQSAAADALRCGGPHCVHLLTTRLKDVAQRFAGHDQAAFVPELETDPAFELLQAYAPDACAADPAAAGALVQTVGGLPLALELLGGYLGATRRSATATLSQNALAEMGGAKQRLALACKRLGDVQGQDVTLRETILLSLQGLEEEPGGEKAVNAFYALGAMAPKPADFTWVAVGAVADCGEETIAWLLERNLVELVDADRGQLALHQALAYAARGEMDAEAIARHRDYYLTAVNEDREDWRQIEQFYEQISWAWNDLLEDETVLTYIGALRIYQERRGLWADTVSWINRGLAVTTTLDLKEDRGVLLNNIGEVYRSLGQPEEALAYYNEALPIRREVGDRAGEATTLNNIGAVYRRLGQPEEALAYYNEALPISREVGDRAGEGTTLNNIGMVYDGLGQPEEALAYYNEALPISREVGNRAVEATTLNNIGAVYRGLGQPEEALAYYNEALPMHREVGNRAMEATTLNNLGAVYRGLGQPEKALAYYNEALPIRREVGDRWGEATTRYNILRIYWEWGELAAATTEMKTVVELTAAVQSPYLARFKEELAQLEAALAANK